MGLSSVLWPLILVVKGLWKPVSCHRFSFLFLSIESGSYKKRSVWLRGGWWCGLKPGLEGQRCSMALKGR